VKKDIAVIKKHHKEILRYANLFYDAITDLRFEGRAAFGKNIRAIKRIMNFFRVKFLSHLNKEDVLLSFVSRHIPKFEPMSRMLFAEHKEIRVNLEVLEFLFEGLTRERAQNKRAQMTEKLRDRGTYFTYLLQNHVRVEEEGIYKTLNEDLHPEEKKALVSDMKRTKL